MTFATANQRTQHYQTNYPDAFDSGYQNAAIRFAYIPDFATVEELQAYIAGYRCGKDEKVK